MRGKGLDLRGLVRRRQGRHKFIWGIRSDWLCDRDSTRLYNTAISHHCLFTATYWVLEAPYCLAELHEEYFTQNHIFDPRRTSKWMTENPSVDSEWLKCRDTKVWRTSSHFCNGCSVNRESFVWHQCSSPTQSDTFAQESIEAVCCSR